MTQRLSDLAADRRVWLGLGLLERDRGRLYDSAVLFSPAGELVLKYQRVTPGWHGHHADPAIYGHGVSVPLVGTPMGTVAFLICGDLFDDYMVDHVRELAPDWVLLPFARCFSEGTCDQVRWDEQEMGQYAERVDRLGVTALMVNYLADASLANDHSFGGAWVVAGDGRVAAQYPLGQPGILFGEVEPGRDEEVDDEAGA
jgi:N-carbamoylputrescine amidase